VHNKCHGVVTGMSLILTELQAIVGIKRKFENTRVSYLGLYQVGYHARAISWKLSTNNSTTDRPIIQLYMHYETVLRIVKTLH